jgi:hypothetical protein
VRPAPYGRIARAAARVRPRSSCAGPEGQGRWTSAGLGQLSEMKLMDEEDDGVSLCAARMMSAPNCAPALRVPAGQPSASWASCRHHQAIAAQAGKPRQGIRHRLQGLPSAQANCRRHAALLLLQPRPQHQAHCQDSTACIFGLWFNPQTRSASLTTAFLCANLTPHRALGL